MSGAAVASLSGFRYWYPNAGTPSIDGVNLEIEPGITLIAGASGSGKSSLLRVFNGLVPHFHGGTVSGTASVCGHDVITTSTRVLATKVGFVFQDPELQSVYPSVERDVAFGLENIGTPPVAMRSLVNDALERTGITHLRGRAVATLSGGERQRLALAGVLAMRPRMLVLDEPLSQLDDAGARALTATLADLAKRRYRGRRRGAPLRAPRLRGWPQARRGRRPDQRWTGADASVRDRARGDDARGPRRGGCRMEP